MNHILYVVTSEKAVRGIEKENKLTFVVNNTSTKTQIRQEVEKEYNEKVKKVTTSVSADGRKKATVSFVKQNAAGDLAAKLKVI